MPLSRRLAIMRMPPDAGACGVDGPGGIELAGPVRARCGKGEDVHSVVKTNLRGEQLSLAA